MARYTYIKPANPALELWEHLCDWLGYKFHLLWCAAVVYFIAAYDILEMVLHALHVPHWH